MGYDAPYRGLRVVDLSQGIAGPYCAMLLAQHGADVVKVEPIGSGDWARTLGAVYGDHTAYSVIGNLGKRSLALDLKHEEGKAILHRLVSGADVFIEGFRPGVIGRLGFGYEAVAAANPRILYVSVSGFGQHGPLAERPAMDPVIQAFTGLIAENKGEDGIPHRVQVIVIDMSTGLYAFQALAPAIHARRDEERGRYIETSLLQTGAALQAVRMMAQYLEKGRMQPGRVPGGVFQCADGWIQFVIFKDEEFRALAAAMGRADLGSDPRYATVKDRLRNEATLMPLVRSALAERPIAYWADALEKARVLYERVNTYFDFLKQPQVAATELVAWLPQPGMAEPVPVPRVAGQAPLEAGAPLATAPTLGQHSEEVLAELGFTPEAIAGLAARGVISGPVRAKRAS